MNFLDAVIIIPLAWGAYKGFQRGFIIEVALLMALLLGLMGGLKFADKAAVFLSSKFEINSQVLPFVSFLAVFIAIIILVVLFGKLLETVVSMTGLGIVNKIAGGMLGITKWVLAISTFLFLFGPVDSKYNLLSSERKESSMLYQPVKSFSEFVIPAVSELKEKYRDRIQFSIIMRMPGSSFPSINSSSAPPPVET